MKDIISELNCYVEKHADLHTLMPIFQDTFPGVGTDEIMCRMEPGAAVEQRYLDGSRTGSFTFAYYSKSTDMQAARGSLDSIIRVLDLPVFTDFSGVGKLKIEPTTTTAFIQKTEKNELIYTCAFRLDYLTGG